MGLAQLTCIPRLTAASTSVLVRGGMSVDHASGVAAPKSDPVFLSVKPGMCVIVTDTDGAWRMADVIWVDGGARPKGSNVVPSG